MQQFCAIGRMRHFGMKLHPVKAPRLIRYGGEWRVGADADSAKMARWIIDDLASALRKAGVRGR